MSSLLTSRIFGRAVMVLLLGAMGACSRAGDPAGILLYARHGGHIQVLVGEDSAGRRGWSGFGGAALPGEGTALTAARETSEETAAVYAQDWLLQQIVGTRSSVYKDFHLYFAEVPYVAAERITARASQATRPALREFHCYTWIPVAEIEALLSGAPPHPAGARVTPRYLPQGHRSGYFWPVWLESLRHCHTRRALPWQQSDQEAIGRH